jgi:hypothetical protein
MIMKRCILKPTGTLAVIAVLMVFLFTSASGAADKPKEIILGGITALSGPAAPWGIGMQNTWQMAVDDINNGGWWWKKKGITVNGEKYNFKLQVYDHAFDASKAVSAANRLISRDGVKYILAFDGGMIKAFQPISEKAKVFTVAYASPGKDYINPKNFYTWMYGVDCMSFSIPGLKKIRTTNESQFSSRIIGRGTPPPKRLASGYPKPNLKLYLMNIFLRTQPISTRSLPACLKPNRT